MTDHSSASINPPKNWQDFERNSRILFRYILNDIHVQNNGRQGQRQHGVDIYGRKNGDGDYFGIQCKGKDHNFGGEVTEKELREEVYKTINFTPLLSHFILITTGHHDANIQKIARKLTSELENQGRKLVVSVWGWEVGELPTWGPFHSAQVLIFPPVLLLNSSGSVPLVVLPL